MFYTYNQNNSGGSFDFDPTKGITHYVIIEADSPNQADAKAEEVGLYFNGCDTGQDCDCCGDRWSTTYSDGSKKPEIYGKTPAAFIKEKSQLLWMKPNPEVVIHFKGKKKFQWVGGKPVDTKTKRV